MNLTKLSSAWYRTGVSDRAAAIIASSVLHDNARSSETNTILVLNQSKVRRSRQRDCSILQERDLEAAENKDIIALYFDGRKHRTLAQKLIGDKTSKETLQEEHVALITEPWSKYFGHLALQTGSANAIANGIFDYMSADHLELDNFVTIGCGGTAVNTRAKGGAIRLIELKLNKHWTC